MLEFIRSHQRLAQFLLLIFIVPSFAFVGLESYSRFSDSADTVAKVDGKAITQQEWDNAQREQMDRLRQMMGPRFDQKIFETQEFKQGVLDGLIAQRVLAAEIASKHMTVSDQSLQQTIMNTFNFRTADGKFDIERYRSVLASQGMTPAMFDARLRQDIMMQQIGGAIRYGSILPKQVAATISDIGAQEREVQELAFRSTDYLKDVTVSEEALREYYNQNGAQFTIPEQVKAEYVILDPETVASRISVTDADIKSYYEQNAARYATPEQRRASHILIAASKDASEADKAAAKAKAEQILAQVRENPRSFAQLAKANSQDPGSAANGGELPLMARGSGLVKPFEDVMFKLKQGEISDLVQTDFGYHIITVTAIKPAVPRSLQEVRNEIAADIKKQLLAKKYAELAETFSNTVYEQADGLKPVADKLNLKIQKVSGLTRDPNPALGNSPVNNPKFLQAIFSEDATKNKRNTEAVEIAPQVLIAGHVTEYQPATLRPFEEVKAAIQERVKLQEATKLAAKAGEERLSKLNNGGDAGGFPAAKMVSRSKTYGLTSEAMDAIMKADTRKLPAYVGVNYPLQGYAIYRINKVVTPQNIDQQRRESERQQLEQINAQQEMASYLDALKKKYKVEILKKATEGDSQKK